MTRMDSEEQVDYSGVSGSVGGLRSTVEEFDVDYFIPHPSFAKTTNPSSDELRSNDRTQLAPSKMQEAPILLEPSLSSKIQIAPAVCSEDSFPLVIRAPTIPQIVVTTPIAIVPLVPSTVPLVAPTTLLVGGEDSFKFSFEGASGVGEATGNGSPSESTLVGYVALATSTGIASHRVPSSASSLLQLLAPHILSLVQGRTFPLAITMEATPLAMVQNLALSALDLTTDAPFKEFFNFSVSNFMQLLRRCVSVILNACNLLELGRPILNSYLDNIERIGGYERAASYRACLEALEEQVQLLNTLCQ